MNPDRTYPNWYKNVVSLWILFGMAWLALIINLCISLLENARDLCQHCKRESKGMGQDLMNSNQNISLEPEDGQNCSLKNTKPADTKPTGPDWIEYIPCSTEVFALLKGNIWLTWTQLGSCFVTGGCVTTELIQMVFTGFSDHSGNLSMVLGMATGCLKNEILFYRKMNCWVGIKDWYEVKSKIYQSCLCIRVTWFLSIKVVERKHGFLFHECILEGHRLLYFSFFLYSDISLNYSSCTVPNYETGTQTSIWNQNWSWLQR